MIALASLATIITLAIVSIVAWFAFAGGGAHEARNVERGHCDDEGLDFLSDR